MPFSRPSLTAFCAYDSGTIRPVAVRLTQCTPATVLSSPGNCKEPFRIYPLVRLSSTKSSLPLSENSSDQIRSATGLRLPNQLAPDIACRTAAPSLML